VIPKNQAPSKLKEGGFRRGAKSQNFKKATAGRLKNEVVQRYKGALETRAERMGKSPESGQKEKREKRGPPNRKISPQKQNNVVLLKIVLRGGGSHRLKRGSPRKGKFPLPRKPPFNCSRGVPEKPKD